jgi:hypothetical protein
MIKQHILATLPENDGGMAAGDLGRGKDNVVIALPPNGERGGKLHHPVILGILTNYYSGHDTTANIGVLIGCTKGLKDNSPSYQFSGQNGKTPHHPGFREGTA